MTPHGVGVSMVLADLILEALHWVGGGDGKGWGWGKGKTILGCLIMGTMQAKGEGGIADFSN